MTHLKHSAKRRQKHFKINCRNNLTHLGHRKETKKRVKGGEFTQKELKKKTVSELSRKDVKYLKGIQAYHIPTEVTVA